MVLVGRVRKGEFGKIHFCVQFDMEKSDKDVVVIALILSIE